MADIEPFGLNLPILKGSENYANWASSMEVVLKSQDVLRYANGTTPIPQPYQPKQEDSTEALAQRARLYAQEYEAWKAGDAKAVLYIYLQATPSIQAYFDNHTSTAHELWTFAKTQFGRSGYSSYEQAWLKLCDLKVEDCSSRSVEEYNQHFMLYLNQLAEVDGTTLPDGILVAHFLRGLGNRFHVWTSTKRSEARAQLPTLDSLMVDVQHEARDMKSTSKITMMSKDEMSKVRRGRSFA